jgi:hypothetical protein
MGVCTCVRTTVAVTVAAALALTACTARNKVEASESGPQLQSTASSTAPSEGGSQEGAFGDLPSPCGEGDITVEPSEAGRGADQLYIGVPNDRSTTIRSGLNRELWDTSTAFAAWCNDQGGIGGLPIELVDLDAKLFEVPAVVAIACRDVFMMVGGGQVQDDMQFSGQPESDFHECHMADIPAFAISPQKAGSNGHVEPLPNPAEVASTLGVQALQEVYPEKAESIAEVWGDLPAMRSARNRHLAESEQVGIASAGSFSYPVTGMTDWTPLAQQVIESGATAITFTGEPTNLGALMAKLREQGWEGTPVLEANLYDRVYPESAGVASARGSFIRTSFHPFEEADRWPAVQQYLDIVEEYVPDPKQGALLGMQSFSAWLLFAVAADDCAAANDGVLTRDCVLEAADAIEGWTAGGLHAPSGPGRDGEGRPNCEMVLDVDEDGEFVRLFPELGSDDDAGDGFWCRDDYLVDVPDNEGLGEVDPDRPV